MIMATNAGPARVRIVLELATIVVMAAAFLVLFQDRPRYVDAILGLVAVGLIALGTSRSTALWALQPLLQGDRRTRRLRAAREAALFSVPVVVAFFVAALALGYASGGWGGALERVGNWHVVAALLLYFPWALLQQFVFQFFLLGRLLYLLPPAVAIGVTALAFSAVHFPRLPVMAGTLVAGTVWALIYRRQRSLLPLAASHALLGSTLHYWVFGRDLLASWLGAGPAA
jgi:membrane protease YdiL (CAAX protease family)